MNLYSFLVKFKMLSAKVNLALGLTTKDKKLVEKLQCLIMRSGNVKVNNNLFGNTVFIKEFNGFFLLIFQDSRKKRLFSAYIVNVLNVSSLNFGDFCYKDYEVLSSGIRIMNGFLEIPFAMNTNTTGLYLVQPISFKYCFALDEFNEGDNSYYGIKVV